MPAKIISADDPRVQAILGKKFNRLTAVKFIGMHRNKKTNQGAQLWQFVCECGNHTKALLNNVKRGSIISCGCVHDGPRTHGFGSRKNVHPVYGVWCTMIQRCGNPNVKAWKNYGGRGIVVCDRWKTFENFLEDMIATYRPGLSLDRKDNNGPYSPENCKWETYEVQALNKRSSRLITFKGETMNLISWARRIGITHSALIRRLQHWSFDRAMTTLPLPWCYDI